MNATNVINESIICAGFGGQGIMVLGKVLAEAGMDSGFNVTWLPAYGAEVRGGTAHSDVRISDRQVASPVVSRPETAIIMNGPSLDKFEARIAENGLLMLNTSMAKRIPERKDLDTVSAALTDEAIKLGNIRVANMIAAGIYIAKKDIIKKEVLRKVIEKMAGDKKELIDINLRAVDRGMEIGRGRS